jgi:outer membrane immunogenic protein
LTRAKSILAGLALGLVLSTAASAADMALKSPAVIVDTGYNWNGLYIGVVAGGGTENTGHFFTATNLNAGSWKGSGGFAGGTAGYNFQFPGSGFVLGIEGDWAGSKIKGAFGGVGCNTGDCYTDIKSIGTVRGRAGFTLDRYLLYVTGGAAFAKTNAGIYGSSDRGTETRNGWTAGGGVEAMLVRGVSIKGEYLYADFGNKVNYVIGGNVNPVRVRNDVHMYRVGINFRLGGDSAFTR